MVLNFNIDVSISFVVTITTSGSQPRHWILHSKDLKKMQRPTKPSRGAPNVLKIPHIHWMNTDNTILLLLWSSNPPLAFYLTPRMGPLWLLLIYSVAVIFSPFFLGGDHWVSSATVRDGFVCTTQRRTCFTLSLYLIISPWYCNKCPFSYHVTTHPDFVTCITLIS